jgi:hypothetical protein
LTVSLGGSFIIDGLRKRGVSVYLDARGRPFAGPRELLTACDLAELRANRDAVRRALEAEESGPESPSPVAFWVGAEALTPAEYAALCDRVDASSADAAAYNATCPPPPEPGQVSPTKRCRDHPAAPVEYRRRPVRGGGQHTGEYCGACGRWLRWIESGSGAPVVEPTDLFGG